MLGHTPFYNRSIHKVVVAFGTLLNDIEIVRFKTDGTLHDHLKVPLSYAQKEKYITRTTSDPTLNKSILANLPRIGFTLDGLSYDPSRKQISTIQRFAKGSIGYSSQYSPVPYNFDFSASIFTRNIEDASQILEQIIPFFTPDYTLTVDFIPELGRTYDLPVILDSVTSSIEYEGDMSTTRIIVWDLKFTAKGYIWPPVKSVVSGIIKKANVDIMATMTSNTPAANIIVVPDPITAEANDDYGYTETITEFI